jgi:hypothetical protein
MLTEGRGAMMILIRLFIFGMVTISTGDKTAVLLMPLMPDVPGHIPYVAFDPKTCADCKKVKVWKEEPYGFLLANHRIHLTGVTETDPAVEFAMTTPSLGLLPADSIEAQDFRWIASLTTILSDGHYGAQDRAVDGRCLDPKDPTQCKAPLKALMFLTSGRLQTDFLIENGSGQVAPFKFKSGYSDQQVREQAVASVIGLVAKVPTGTPIYLELKDLKDKQLSTPIKVQLTPQPCEEDPDLKCIDVFIGNLGQTDSSDDGTIGQHFEELYNFLTKHTKFSKSYVPYLMGGTEDDSHEPRCLGDELAADRQHLPCRRDLPGTSVPADLNAADVRGTPGTKFTKVTKFIALVVPYSRPLCPPGVVSP